MEGSVPKFTLRPARVSDYDFAERLYLETMEPLVTESIYWTERRLISTLKRSLKLSEVRIITVDGANVGWLQMSESDRNISLRQIHIRREFRSRGIGTQLIRDLFIRARAKKKPVSLSVVHTNPAVALYKRLGFEVIGEDRYKLHMRWDGSSVYRDDGSRGDPPIRA